MGPARAVCNCLKSASSFDAYPQKMRRGVICVFMGFIPHDDLQFRIYSVLVLLSSSVTLSSGIYIPHEQSGLNDPTIRLLKRNVHHFGSPLYGYKAVFKGSCDAGSHRWPNLRDAAFSVGHYRCKSQTCPRVPE